MSWWSSFFNFSEDCSGCGPYCPGSPPGEAAGVHAVSVQETRGEVDHCLPFISHLDRVSEVRDSLLHPRVHSGLHVKPGKPASAVDAKGTALSLGLSQAAPPGLLKESHRGSRDCEVSLGTTEPKLCQPAWSWQSPLEQSGQRRVYLVVLEEVVSQAEKQGEGDTMYKYQLHSVQSWLQTEQGEKPWAT